mmetsp:Transcript_27996/g.73843  ORF Transcript_27996/g.73843 Transcript_27996/m.73843 type:complete len:687 (-) Transcript_27996:213-2273(-)
MIIHEIVDHLRSWEAAFCDPPAHTWTTQFKDCPYGWAGPGGVTWPDWKLAQKNNVTALLDSGSGPLLYNASVVFCYIPYVVALWACVVLVLRRGTRELHFVLFIAIATGSTTLLKMSSVQARPEQSCLSSCGMPSSHSALAVGFFMLHFFDFMTRARPVLPSFYGDMSIGPDPRRWLHHLCEVYVTSSLSAWDEITHAQQLMHLAGWMCILLPVPLARIVVHDHSPLQVFAGMFMGFTIATVWVFIIYTLQHRYNHRLGHVLLGCRCFRILHHNMALPCYMTEIRCKKETFSCDTRAVSMWESASPRDELEWYLDQTVCRRTKLQLSRVLTCDEQHYLEFRERKLRNLLSAVDHKEIESGLELVTPSIVLSSRYSSGHTLVEEDTLSDSSMWGDPVSDLAAGPMKLRTGSMGALAMSRSSLRQTSDLSRLSTELTPVGRRVSFINSVSLSDKAMSDSQFETGARASFLSVTDDEQPGVEAEENMSFHSFCGRTPRREILDDIKVKLGSQILCVTGGTECPNTEVVSKLARRLNGRLPNVSFATCGSPGAQRTFALRCGRRKNKLWHVLPVGGRSGYGVGVDVEVGASLLESRAVYDQLGDVYISIDRRLVLATGSGCVIPIIRRDGDASARGIHGDALSENELQRPFVVSEEEWRILFNVDIGLDEYIDGVVEIVVKVLESSSTRS